MLAVAKVGATGKLSVVSPVGGSNESKAPPTAGHDRRKWYELGTNLEGTWRVEWIVWKQQEISIEGWIPGNVLGAEDLFFNG